MNDISLNKSFIDYWPNINDLAKIDLALNNKNKVICLYDSNENIIDKNGISNNKCDTIFIKKIELFVSNKRTFNLIPIIILNNLSLKSINLLKNCFVFKNPNKYNISIIVIGENNIIFES